MKAMRIEAVRIWISISTGKERPKLSHVCFPSEQLAAAVTLLVLPCPSHLQTLVLSVNRSPWH